MHQGMGKALCNDVHTCLAAIAPRHTGACLEDLQMWKPRSVVVDLEAPARKLQAISGMNRASGDLGRFDFRHQFDHKLT
jgi:hypothetical protein